MNEDYQSDLGVQAPEGCSLRHRALVETALAYWRRGSWQQYDSIDLVDAPSREGPGSRRCVDDRAPEASTAQDTGFFVCSTFLYAIYWEALGHKIAADPDHCTCRHQLMTDDASVVYRWREEDPVEKETAIAHVRSILEPGDILTTRAATSHTLLFLGKVRGDSQDYMLHAWEKNTIWRRAGRSGRKWAPSGSRLHRRCALPRGKRSAMRRRASPGGACTICSMRFWYCGL